MNTEIVQSYRKLYRQGLHAVQYSSPARHILRNRLRLAFRRGLPTDYNAKKAENTVLFLINATKAKGLEHKILKNLIHVWYWEEQHRAHPKESVYRAQEKELRKAATRHFYITLMMLNESMDTCLPTIGL